MGDQLFYNIPMSFRFDPTDEELIREYLVPKVMGFPLPWNGIVEKELYGDNASPWNVFNDIDSDNSFSLYCNTKRESGKTKKTVYVFTKVTKAAPNSKKRIARRAGCGTWNGQTGSKDIIDSTTGDIIGGTKMFSFQYSKEDVGDFGHWIMHEYSLTAQWKTD
ncbi:hypothetical protein C2S51_011761, partial [Perilla frutescens var. frutescens]